MTRKKSNVKALALAVTCAILAGGYSGLNPVYAASDYGDYTVKYDATDNCLDYVTNNSSGYNTIGIYKIKLNNIVLDSSIGTSPSITVGSCFSIDGSNGSINAANNKFMVSGAGAITATSLSLNGQDVKAAIDAKANQTDVNTNKDDISNLKTNKANQTDVYTKAESDGKFAGKTYEDKVDALETTVGNNSSGLVKKVGDLEGKTTNITYDATNNTTTFTGKTVVQGANGTVTINNAEIEIKGINNDSITLDSGYVKASGYVEAPKFYIDNDNKFEKNSLSVAGVDSNGNQQSVRIGGGTITASGDVNVGGSLNTNTIGEATTGTGVTVDGVLLKDKGISAAGGKFTVDADGAVSAANGNFTVDSNGTKVKGNVTFNEGQNNQVKITDEGVVVGLGSTVIGSDGVYAGGHTETTAKAVLGADGSIKGAGNGAGKYKFSVDGTSGDTVVGGTLDVTGDTTLKGKLDVTGDTNLKGKLDVTGNATVGGTFGVTGAATLGSTLEVTGKATLKDELQVDKKATFGSAAGSQTVINGGDITADGQLNAKSARIGGVNGVGISDSGVITGVTKLTTKALEVTDDLVVSGDITGAALKGTSLAITGNGTITGDFGVTGAITGATINGATITTNSFNGATIGATTFNGVTLTTDGDVSGRNMTASGTVKGNEITDGAGASMKAGTVTGTKITDGTGFTATGGNVTAKDINATTATIAGVGFASNNVSGINNLTATGTIQGATLKVNDSNLLGNDGLKATKAVIDNLTIDGASITSNNADGSVGVAGITVDKTGAITGVKAIDGVAVAGNTTSGLTIGSGATAVTIGGNSLALSSTNFSVDDDGDVTGQSFTAGTSHLNNGELKLNDKNIWTTAEGIKAEKAVIGVNTLNGTGISTTGTLDVEGVAKFGKNDADQTKITQGKAEFTQGGKTTTIKGGEIEADKLTVNDIVLKNSMTNDATGSTITIKGSDGSMSVAGGKFAVDKDGQLTNKITGIASGFGYETKLETSKSGIKANYTNAINGNQNIIDMGASGISIGVVSGTTPSVGAGFKAELDAATMGYGTANSIVVSADTIKSALGTDVTRVMTNSTAEQSIVDKVGTAKRSLKADEIVDEVAGMTVKTNSDGTLLTNGTTTTLINGSAITSTNGGATGVLDGSNLTLTNGANSTALTAGGATFTGDAGEKGGKVTTINGGTITTDTLNVDRINLGGEVIDKGAAGVEANSKLYMDAQGNFRAAGGNFKVNGADGAMTNTVGNTTFTTDTTGASMNYAGTANSNISVADGKAEMAVGTNAAVTATDGKVEIKGGTQNVTTTDAGTVFENSAHNTPFVTGGAANTVINGNEITTGKLTTDQLVITGSGAAAGAGTGTIALGGDGSITSNIKDAATGKEATFQTNADGTFTHAKDGANETTNTVNAQGNTNKVTDGTNTSTVTQTATSIGGVVTNGTVTMKQELTAEGVKVTDELGDPANYTQITDKEVSITDPKNTGKRINLSDLGQLNDLDGELTARSEYTSNPTAVGAINAEAGIRREEVARLDNRIDDVNNRVDKVGAMAAAIASLKSIGYDPQAPSEFSIGLGQYKGETGVAMGFFHYPNKNFMINVSLSTAGGETMGGIGATWRFGHKSPQKLLEEQREAQAKKELAAAEKYQAAAKLAKEAQERAEYAAKLARQAQVSADNAKAAADATQAKHFQ